MDTIDIIQNLLTLSIEVIVSVAAIAMILDFINNLDQVENINAVIVTIENMSLNKIVKQEVIEMKENILSEVLAIQTIIDNLEIDQAFDLIASESEPEITEPIFPEPDVVVLPILSEVMKKRKPTKEKTKTEPISDNSAEKKTKTNRTTKKANPKGKKEENMTLTTNLIVESHTEELLTNTQEVIVIQKSEAEVNEIKIGEEVNG